MNWLNQVRCNWAQNTSITLFIILTLTTVCNVLWNGKRGQNLSQNVTNAILETMSDVVNSTEAYRIDNMTTTTVNSSRSHHLNKRSYSSSQYSPEQLDYYKSYQNAYSGLAVEGRDPYAKNLAVDKEKQKEVKIDDSPDTYDLIVAICKQRLLGNSTSNDTNHDNATHTDDHSATCAMERGGRAPVLWILFYILLVLFLFIGLAGICDDFFVPSLEAISEKLNLSKDVAGATFMAAGSSAPEIFTSITAVGVGSDVGVGTIVGSAVFNLLIIVALTAALAGKVLDLDWRPFIRDCVFYGASVVAFLIFSWDAKFHYWESLFLLVLYSLYIVVMKFNSLLMFYLAKFKCCEIPSPTNGTEADTDVEQVQEDETVKEKSKPDEEKPCNSTCANEPLSTKKVSFQHEKEISTPEQVPTPNKFKSSPSTIRSSSSSSVDTRNSQLQHQQPPRLRSVKLCFDEEDIEFTIPSSGFPLPVYFLNEAFTPVTLPHKLQQNYPQGSVHAQHGYTNGCCNSNGSNCNKRRENDEIKHSYEVKTNIYNINMNNNEGASSSSHNNGDAVHVVEDEEELMQIFPCLPSIQHTKPIRPTSSECLPGTKFVFAYVMFLLALPWICAFTWTIPNCRKPSARRWYMVSFTFSILWIAIISYYMVELVEKIGCLLGIDSYTMGLVVVAVGTSVPDAISSVLVARDGYGDMAVSNAMGSNVFDINLGLGLPFFIGNIITMQPVSLLSPLQQCAFDAVPLSIKIVPHTKFAFILILILVVAVAFLVAVRFRLNKILGSLFVGMYGIFLIYAFVQEKVCHGLYC